MQVSNPQSSESQNRALLVVRSLTDNNFARFHTSVSSYLYSRLAPLWNIASFFFSMHDGLMHSIIMKPISKNI